MPVSNKLLEKMVNNSKTVMLLKIFLKFDPKCFFSGLNPHSLK